MYLGNIHFGFKIQSLTHKLSLGVEREMEEVKMEVKNSHTFNKIPFSVLDIRHPLCHFWLLGGIANFSLS